MTHVVKTLVVVVVLWLVFLYAIPMGVSIVEIELGIQRFPPQLPLATFMLGGFSVLGLWAALTLAIGGQGTPTLFAPPQRLVTSGPYAYLRHPFVTALVGQCVALAIAMGSIPVIAYAATMLTVYYFFVRPSEERGLERRFGAPVRAYWSAVRGFRPRLTPYRLTGEQTTAH